MSKRKIIAVDFDGTLAVDAWPDVGEPITQTIERLRQEQKAGAYVILWTNREGEPLRKAIEFCKEQGILLGAVNDNLPHIIDFYGCNVRKIFANEYWDDRAISLPWLVHPDKRKAD